MDKFLIEFVCLLAFLVLSPSFVQILFTIFISPEIIRTDYADDCRYFINSTDLSFLTEHGS